MTNCRQARFWSDKEIKCNNTHHTKIESGEHVSSSWKPEQEPKSKQKFSQSYTHGSNWIRASAANCKRNVAIFSQFWLFIYLYLSLWRRPKAGGLSGNPAALFPELPPPEDEELPGFGLISIGIFTMFAIMICFLTSRKQSRHFLCCWTGGLIETYCRHFNATVWKLMMLFLFAFYYVYEVHNFPFGLDTLHRKFTRMIICSPLYHNSCNAHGWFRVRQRY